MDPKSSMDEPPPSSLLVPVPGPPPLSPLPSQPVAKKARITAINCSSSSRSNSSNNGSTSVERYDAAKTDEQPPDWVNAAIVTNKDELERIAQALNETTAEARILQNEAIELQKTLSLLQSAAYCSAHDEVGLGPDVASISDGTITHQPLDKEQEAKSRLNDVVQSRLRVEDRLERLRKRQSFVDFERACLDVCAIVPATTANAKGATAADSTTEAAATAAATRLRLVPRPAGYAKPLGEALLHARAQGFFPISELVIFVHLLLPDVVDESIPKSDSKPSAVASAATATTATASATAAIASAMTYIEPLLQYIGSTNDNVGTTDTAASAPLQSVRLLDYDKHITDDRNVKDIMMESILEAICANPGIVNVHYAWSHHSLSARTLSAFLTKKAPSLHSLTVDLGRRRYSDDNDHALLGVALATLATGGILQSLEIQGMERAEEEPTLSILTQMRVAGSSSNSHSPLALTELKLHWEREVPQVCCEALAALLHCTMGLEHLELSNGRFDGSKLLVILSGLAHTKRDARHPFVAISKLSFCYCYFDEEGTRALTDFMQTKVFIDKDHDSEPMFSSSCLRELHLGVDDDEMFDSCEAGLTIAQLLQMQPSSPLGYDEPQGVTEGSEMVAGHQEQPLYYSTVGSQIQTISLSPFTDYADGFFTPLIEAPERVEMLTRLKLDYLDERACRSLTQCVSKVSSIRAVHLTYVTLCECASILLDMLREHSSICSFSCDERYSFTAPQWRLVEAYCQRNAYLNRHYGRLDAADKSDGDTDDRKVDRMDKRLHPAFHQAAAHVPNRKSHVFIRDLVTCGQSIGYD